MIPLAALTARFPREGRLEEWIGLPPGRREAIEAVDEVMLTEAGLRGDHAREGRRALTLIQAEHLPVIAALMERAAVGCKGRTESPQKCRGKSPQVAGPAIGRDQ